MIHTHLNNQYIKYNDARTHFIANPALLINLEKFITNQLTTILTQNLAALINDYNEASYLHYSWANNPPEDRGRKPIADQYPWIEVAETVIGPNLLTYLNRDFKVRYLGSPIGPDLRCALTSPMIQTLTNNYTDTVWFCLDLKSAGPRDDVANVTLSTNQVSGDGLWLNQTDYPKNTVMQATGANRSHVFHPSLLPLLVLSNNSMLPVITIALKLAYDVLPTQIPRTRNNGQPLKEITVANIPNGLLLTQDPNNYLKHHNGLLFPGKDDKSTKPNKLRARISFKKLKTIADWRIQTIR